MVLVRLFQVPGAARWCPARCALVQASCRDRASRARAVGLWGGIGGWPAAASGPVLGGALSRGRELPQLVFAVDLPVGLFASSLSRRRVASPMGQRDRRGNLQGPRSPPSWR